MFYWLSKCKSVKLYLNLNDIFVLKMFNIFFFFFFFFLLSSQILNIRSKITFVWAGNNNIKQIYFFYFLQEMWVVAYMQNLCTMLRGSWWMLGCCGWLLGHLWYVDSS